MVPEQLQLNNENLQDTEISEHKNVDMLSCISNPQYMYINIHISPPSQIK